MKKEEANEMVNLLKRLKYFTNDRYDVEKENFDESLKDFHQWTDGKKNLGAFLIREKDTKIAFWILFNNWSSNYGGYHLIIFPENRSGPLIEIRTLTNLDLEWRYKPSKRDGKNPERKDYFIKCFGSLDVIISVPQNEEEVVDFIEDIFQLVGIRIKSDELSDDIPSIREVFIEGRRLERKHFARERNSKIISLLKKQFKNDNGKLFCQVCKFDFEEKYGQRGNDFIEAHHTRPLSELDVNGEETKIEEIILVCSNCHRMIHRARPWLKIDELKKLLK